MATETALQVQKKAIGRSLIWARRAFTAISPFPSAASWLAFRLFLTPRGPKRPSWERELLEKGERFYVDGIRAWRFGRGPVVGLVHGWEGRGAQLGHLVEPLVARGFSVVLFDMPAHGDTSGKTADVPSFARAIAKVDAWVGGFHAIVAHSFGGLGVAWAYRTGELDAERVVLIASPTGPELYLKKMGRMLGLAPHVVDRTRERLEDYVGERVDNIEGGRLYRAVDAEVLVVHDVDDNDVPAEAAEAIAEHTSSRVKWTRGLGHRRVLKDREVVECVADFVAFDRPATDMKRELVSGIL